MRARPRWLGAKQVMGSQAQKGNRVLRRHCVSLSRVLSPETQHKVRASLLSLHWDLEDEAGASQILNFYMLNFFFFNTRADTARKSVCHGVRRSPAVSVKGLADSGDRNNHRLVFNFSRRWHGIRNWICQSFYLFIFFNHLRIYWICMLTFILAIYLSF